MKKVIILSVVATSLLFIGCGKNKSSEQKKEPAKQEAQAPVKKESVAEKATKAIETMKSGTTTAMEKSKEMATKAVEATKEAVTKGKEMVKDAKSVISPNTAEAPKAQ